MRTFPLYLLLGGLTLLCLSCTSEELQPVGIPYEKQAFLEAEAMYTIPDVFIPSEGFRGESAEEIRDAVAIYKTQLHEPQLYNWWVTDPHTQAFSVYLEASPEHVFVIQGQIGEDFYTEDEEDVIWINCIYLTGQPTDLTCPPSPMLMQAAFTRQGDSEFEMEIHLVLHEEETPVELAWFGETISMGQFETSLHLRIPVRRPSEKEFIPGRASILISGAVPEEVNDSDPE